MDVKKVLNCIHNGLKVCVSVYLGRCLDIGLCLYILLKRTHTVCGDAMIGGEGRSEGHESRFAEARETPKDEPTIAESLLVQMGCASVCSVQHVGIKLTPTCEITKNNRLGRSQGVGYLGRPTEGSDSSRRRGWRGCGFYLWFCWVFSDPIWAQLFQRPR